MEHGGPHCGVLQLSAKIVRMKIVQKEKKISEDRAKSIQRGTVFNEYINPGEGVIFSKACTDIHHLHVSTPCIAEARKIDVIWHQFTSWIESNTAVDEEVITVAYNDKSCNMKWLWKLTHAPFIALSLHPRLMYFLNPYRVMSHYTSCPLNKKTTKLNSYELGINMDKNSWRHDFQIILGIQLLYMATALDLDGKSKRPS